MGQLKYNKAAAVTTKDVEKKGIVGITEERE